jgi:DNA-binding MarR family transcriptional regulator
MRDEVLGLPGLRWVLCGSRGIVQTAASSPRLEGRLASPLIVGPLSHDAVTEVIGTRRAAYKIRPDAVSPVGRQAFRHLYDILNSNLRNALKHADDFSLWLALESQPPWSWDNNRQLLEIWVTEKADEYNKQTQMGQAAWRAFETLAGMGGTCSPSDNEAFGYSTPMALRPQIKALEDANLVVSSIDDTDKRRKTISITPRGWLVQYARSGYKTPS